jgi:hypothetical protein
MAKVCIQCEKKIGFFQTPIDGVYCSYKCRDAARREIAENDRRSQERMSAARVRAEEEARESQRRAELEQAHARVLASCPKCGSEWAYVHSGGPGGAHTGDCARCGFSADFTAIEKCPVCTAASLVVAPDGDARCPRCKYRRHRERLTGT